MKKKQIIGLIVAALVFTGVGMVNVMAQHKVKDMVTQNVEDIVATAENVGTEVPQSDYIGVVDVIGTIQQQSESSIFDASSGYQHDDTLDYIDDMIADTNNKALLLYVDSPGGAVYESEELYLKLKQYKEETGRPIWEYMAHYAASGGYMISMNSDVIYANPNTVTGSIGVIMAGYDMTGLYEKLGIRYVSITSGVNKDSSAMTDEQIAIYQSQVDECYDRFVEIVSEGREMSQEQVKALADGRTYTAKQALNLGLIDDIALYEDMQTQMCDAVGVDTVYKPAQKTSPLAALFSKVEKVAPKSDSQVLTEIADSKQCGGLMYYAEQLQ